MDRLQNTGDAATLQYRAARIAAIMRGHLTMLSSMQLKTLVKETHGRV